MLQALFKPKLLYRKRIKTVFETNIYKPLIAVIAPIGFGKTTAVKQFLKDKNKIIQIWFELLQSETDDSSIWGQLCNIISNYNLDIAMKLKKHGLPLNCSDAKKLIDIIAEALDREVIFVLDGFDNNKSKVLNNFIELIIYKNIPNLHIIITSRELPILDYKKLECKRLCETLFIKDLLFTIEEENEFFELNGYTLSNYEKTALFKYTEGWAAGIYLALLSYSQTNNFNDLNKHNNLIETSFFNKLDDNIKSCIMKLSITDEFTIEQAIYITKDKNSVNKIKEIAERKYFIEYTNGIYRFHPILKKFAYEQLIQSKISLNSTFNLYGMWYLKNRKIDLAINYYFKAKDYDQMLNTIENYPKQMMNMDSKCIFDLFKSIPNKIRLKHPLAHMIFTYFCIINLDLDYSKDVLNEIKILFKDILNISNGHILAEMNILESLVNFENLEKLIENLKVAHNILKGNSSKLPCKDILLTLGIPYSIFIYYKELGQLKSTIKMLENDFCYYCSSIVNYEAGYNYLIVAEYLFGIGELYKAELFIHKAMFKANLKNQFNIVINSLYMLMWISILNEKLDDFQDYNKTLINLKNKVDSKILIKDIELGLGYIYLCIDELDKVPKWIIDYDLSSCSTFVKNIGCIYITYGKLICAKGLFFKLKVYAESLLENDKLNNYVFITIYMNIFNAIATYNLYGIEAAKPILAKAISLSKYDKIIMPFVENFLFITPLLESFDDDYIEPILKLCKKVKLSVNNLNIIEHKTILTKREEEIMNLVAKGYKNVEISEMLNIMPVTVEKILSNVYKKLNAKNRASAVSKLKNL